MDVFLTWVLIVLGSILFITVVVLIGLNRSIKKDEIELDKLTKRWKEEERLKPIILKKFWDELIKICEAEKIYLYFYDDIYKLNEVHHIDLEDGKTLNIDTRGNYIDEGHLAVGQYCYYKKEDSPERRLRNHMPKIQLLNEDETNVFPWTLAHELGHHFTVYDLDGQSSPVKELAAQHYIMNLAERILTEEERKIIKIHLEVFSHIDEKL